MCLCVCTCIHPTVVGQRLGNKELLEAQFYMQPVTYQRTVGDKFFPELLVYLKTLSVAEASLHRAMGLCNE